VGVDGSDIAAVGVTGPSVAAKWARQGRDEALVIQGVDLGELVGQTLGLLGQQIVPGAGLGAATRSSGECLQSSR